MIRAAYAALNRNDIDSFLDYVDPDVEFNSLIAESEGPMFRGHDGVREWWARVARSLGGLRYEAGEIVDLGDRALAELVVMGKVSDVEVTQRMWQAFKVRDGRAYWWWTCRTESEARDLVGAEE